MQVLVIEDHALVREGLGFVLAGLARSVEVLEAADARHAHALLLQHRAALDLILLDLRLPDAAPFAVLESCRRNAPEVPVVVLSAIEDRADIERALQLGAQGYVFKSAPGSELLAAVRRVLRGQVVTPPRSALEPGRRDESEGPLTPRQRDVLRMLARGDGNKEIAVLLGLAENTVKAHLLHIYRALGVSTRTAAVRKASDLGILQ